MPIRFLRRSIHQSDRLSNRRGNQIIQWSMETNVLRGRRLGALASKSLLYLRSSSLKPKWGLLESPGETTSVQHSGIEYAAKYDHQASMDRYWQRTVTAMAATNANRAASLHRNQAISATQIPKKSCSVRADFTPVVPVSSSKLGAG